MGYASPDLPPPNPHSEKKKKKSHYYYHHHISLEVGKRGREGCVKTYMHALPFFSPDNLLPLFSFIVLMWFSRESGRTKTEAWSGCPTEWTEWRWQGGVQQWLRAGERWRCLFMLVSVNHLHKRYIASTHIQQNYSRLSPSMYMCIYICKISSANCLCYMFMSACGSQNLGFLQNWLCSRP